MDQATSPFVAEATHTALHMSNTLRSVLELNVTVSVVTAGKAFGLGRNASYLAVKNGDIPSVRIGGKIAVPTAPLRRMLGLD